MVRFELDYDDEERWGLILVVCTAVRRHWARSTPCKRRTKTFLIFPGTKQKGKWRVTIKFSDFFENSSSILAPSKFVDLYHFQSICPYVSPFGPAYFKTSDATMSLLLAQIIHISFLAEPICELFTFFSKGLNTPSPISVKPIQLTL